MISKLTCLSSVMRGLVRDCHAYYNRRGLVLDRHTSSTPRGLVHDCHAYYNQRGLFLDCHASSTRHGLVLDHHAPSHNHRVLVLDCHATSHRRGLVLDRHTTTHGRGLIYDHCVSFVLCSPTTSSHITFKLFTTPYIQFIPSFFQSIRRGIGWFHCLSQDDQDWWDQMTLQSTQEPAAPKLSRSHPSRPSIEVIQGP